METMKPSIKLATNPSILMLILSAIAALSLACGSIAAPTLVARQLTQFLTHNNPDSLCHAGNLGPVCCHPHSFGVWGIYPLGHCIPGPPELAGPDAAGSGKPATGQSSLDHHPI